MHGDAAPARPGRALSRKSEIGNRKSRFMPGPCRPIPGSRFPIPDMKKESRRSHRVADLVRSELSSLILMEAHDPELKRVTITEVSMPADLRSARIYFSALGGEEERQIATDALDRAAGYLRGESLAETGRYYDAVQQYQRALELDKNNALAQFRMGEAFFYQRNYAASAQSCRDALEGSTDSNTRWTEVWSHIYLGRIYDITNDRTRAVNEYSKAKQTGDDTGGAQAEAEKSLKKAYTETASS